MKFVATALEGVWIVELERIEDERGFFARSLCVEELASRGLASSYPQQNVSWNARKGTLRGLHYAAPPHTEAKLVRCTAGAIFDVAVDLASGKWIGTDLSAENHRALYIPETCAHGFQTLTDGAEVLYQMSAPYVAEAARGIRWDDPSLQIAWPDAERRIISARDAAFPVRS